MTLKSALKVNKYSDMRFTEFLDFYMQRLLKLQ